MPLAATTPLLLLLACASTDKGGAGTPGDGGAAADGGHATDGGGPDDGGGTDGGTSADGGANTDGGTGDGGGSTDGGTFIPEFACEDAGTDPTTPPSCEDPGALDGSCPNPVLRVDPRDGATDAFVGATVDFTVQAAVDEATVVLTEQGGDQVAGSTTVDGTRIVFTPDGWLSPETTYEARLEFCGGDPCTAFTTSRVGLPLEVDPRGTTWAFSLDDGTWTGMGDASSGLLADLAGRLLVMVTDTADGWRLRAAAAEEAAAAQDDCVPTATWEVGEAATLPTFQTVPAALWLSLAGQPLQLSQVVLTATAAPDGCALQGVRLDGQLDARLLAPLVADALGTDDPEALVDVLEDMGLSTVACSDGQALCYDFSVSGMEGVAVDVVLFERTEADVAADGACAR